tara:strand:+ start:62 stop:742 length:681 start_codon:yes stop_codon:yes gene_type:complete
MIEKEILFIPVFINLAKNNLLLFDENPFYKNWNLNKKNQFLLKYIMQNEDLDDYKLIQERLDFIENYEFNEIISKYELNQNYIIFIILEDIDNYKTFSKFNVSSVKSNFKKEFKYFELDNAEKVKELIETMKIKYDDEWKKINLINSSIKLNIKLNVNSKNILLVKKVEKLLNSIELIEKYYINYFNNSITSYSILSNSTPDKLINEFKKNNLSVLLENNIWIVNE